MVVVPVSKPVLVGDRKFWGLTLEEEAHCHEMSASDLRAYETGSNLYLMSQIEGRAHRKAGISANHARSAFDAIAAGEIGFPLPCLNGVVTTALYKTTSMDIVQRTRRGSAGL